jgi:pyridinium-3,5-bisthiocarboxylic acid mononucleotide nickel chelatase
MHPIASQGEMESARQNGSGMRLCYLDAFSGISGDMTVGALADAGADAAQIETGLASLNTGATVTFQKTMRRGIAATKFKVQGGETRTHRHLKQILQMIEKAEMPDSVKETSSNVFRRLGEAEAIVHNVAIDKVHFHEVGAVDSICDIVGACLALSLLRVGKLFSSPINVGAGTVTTEHGVLPVPAPATTLLLFGKPVYARGPVVELTTPTGAALVATLAADFGSLPAMRIISSGYGAGDLDFPGQANVLRAIVGAPVTGALESSPTTEGH